MSGWGNSSVYNCMSLRDYAAADKEFNKRKPVRSHRWLEHQRPLLNTRRWWYRYEQGAGYYDLVLHRTPMVRYFEPKADGSYTVWLCVHDTRESYRFVDCMGWNTSTGLTTQEGVRVYVPLLGHFKDGDAAGWSAVLHFTPGGKLVLDGSSHTPIAVERSTEEDKGKRTQFLKEMDPVLDLLMLRIPTMHVNAKLSADRTHAFRGMASKQINNVRDLAGVVLIGHEPDVDVLLPYAQECYNTALSRKCAQGDEYMQELISGWPPVTYAPDNVPPVDEGVFRKALRSALIRHTGLDSKQGQLLLPQFPESLPKRYFAAV